MLGCDVITFLLAVFVVVTFDLMKLNWAGKLGFSIKKFWSFKSICDDWKALWMFGYKWEHGKLFLNENQMKINRVLAEGSKKSKRSLWISQDCSVSAYHFIWIFKISKLLDPSI